MPEQRISIWGARVNETLVASIAVILALVVVGALWLNARASVSVGAPIKTSFVLLILGGGLSWGFYNTHIKRGPEQHCPPFRHDRTNVCVLTEQPTLMTTDVPTAEGEYNFCGVAPTGMTTQHENIGVNVIMLRSTSGPFPLRYRLIRPNMPCTGEYLDSLK